MLIECSVIGNESLSEEIIDDSPFLITLSETTLTL